MKGALNMAFFEELGRKAKDVAAVAADKAKDMAAVAADKARETTELTKLSVAIGRRAAGA